MKTTLKPLIVAIGISVAISCNNNSGKGNDTTAAGTESAETPNDSQEPRTPAPSLTADSTGVNTTTTQESKDNVPESKIKTSTDKDNPATITNPK